MNGKKMQVAREIAQFIVRADLSEIPAEVIEKGKQCILDALGCGLYGNEFEATKIATKLAYEWGGRAEASIIGAKAKVPSAMAALANGVAVHVADYDDSSVHLRGHATSVTLPPALAICESKLKSGKDLLLAYIVGVEVGGKLGKIMGWSHTEAGWHGTSTIGTIAAAAASAKALDLTQEKTAHALAIAASGASGIRENFGTMVKSLHAGQASSTGVRAALLAELGYEGSLTAFEGKAGYWRVYSGGNDISRWVDELDEPYTLLSIMFKRYPSCAATHTVLDALEILRKEHPFSWEDVEEVRCLVPPATLSVLIYPRPSNELEAKFSLPYCASTFLVNGRLDLSHFEKEALKDQRVRSLMEKVEMVSDNGMEELIKSSDLLAPTEVHLKLKNQTFTKRVLEAKGGVSFPLQIEEIKTKFRACAGRILGPEKVEKVIDFVSSLESLQKVNSLAEILNP
jgi:2-methylcitrate dehydratase PrpD